MRCHPIISDHVPCRDEPTRIAVASTGSVNAYPQSGRLLLLVITMLARSSRRTTSRKNKLASKLESGRQPISSMIRTSG
jgi:hypothetical protein